MVSEVKIWILVTVVSVMAAILGFVIKLVTREVIKRLDDIVTELKQLTRTTTVQEQQIKRLQEQQNTINHRLNEHAARLRSLEVVHNTKN